MSKCINIIKYAGYCTSLLIYTKSTNYETLSNNVQL